VHADSGNFQCHIIRFVELADTPLQVPRGHGGPQDEGKEEKSCEDEQNDTQGVQKTLVPEKDIELFSFHFVFIPFGVFSRMHAD
jgi:hypothetical protein